MPNGLAWDDERSAGYPNSYSGAVPPGAGREQNGIRANGRDNAQSEYAEAYQHRQLFQQMDQVSQRLHQLDGSMLDAGYQMERGQVGGDSLNGAVTIEGLTSGTDDSGSMM